MGPEKMTFLCDLVTCCFPCLLSSMGHMSGRGLTLEPGRISCLVRNEENAQDEYENEDGK